MRACVNLCTQNVLAAGHSLGGAMANLAAVDIAHTMEWASVKVYTVGAPRAGNHAYAKMYNKLVPDTWGIINYRVRPTFLVLLLIQQWYTRSINSRYCN